MGNAENTDWTPIPIRAANLHLAPYHDQVLQSNNIRTLGDLLQPDTQVVSYKSGLTMAWIAAYKQEAGAFVRGLCYAMDNLVPPAAPPRAEAPEQKAEGT